MKTIIISLGGSIVVPDEIDYSFLRNFKEVIEEYIKKDYRFVIIIGGGSTARKYQKAASKVCKIDDEDLDWLGIHATRINAHLLRTIFKKDAYPKLIKDPTVNIETDKKIIIASGWKPGWSTDYDAVLIAGNLNCDEIINLSNISYVYDIDPKHNKDAKALKQISWKEFRKLVGDKWNPGLNMPFDPIASKEAEKLNLKVIIANGKNLENLKNILDEKEFEGTLIKNQ
jgi:uridylate kinase